MRKLIIAALCAACGLGAAFALTARATGPVALPDLPGLGYSLSMQMNAQTGCGLYVVISGNGVDREIPIGDLPPRCVLAGEQQARIDALLVEFPPPGPQPVVTTVTLPAVTETLPAVTVTGPAVTIPAVAAPVQTVAGPTVTETVVQTVTVAVAAPVAAVAVEEWEAALAVRSQALNDVYGLA